MYEMLVEKLRLNCAARELWLPLVPQYAEQINLLKEAADAIEELSKENESLGKDLTSAVEMLKKKRKPKWIPVTERLPDYDEDVLVYANGLLRVWDRIKTLDDVDYWEDEYGYWVDFNDVDYWMPLPPSPEPPKESE